MLSKSFVRARQIANRYRGDGHAVLRAEKKADRGSLYVYAPIGASFWGDTISAQDIADRLDEVKGVKALDIYVNSEGGDVFDGIAIYNMLRRFDAEKTVHIDGIAASIASVIALAGDRIVTGAGATWMIHNPWGFAMGGSAEMRKTAEVLDQKREDIVDIYAARTGASRAELRALMDAETWMTAAEAKERGFTDEIAEADGEDAVEDSKPSKLTAALRETETRILAATPERDAVTRMQARTLSRRASPPAAGQPATKK